MPARQGILTPRGQPGFPRDRAERTPFTTRQRVRRRARQQALQQTRGVARTAGIGLGAATLALVAGYLFSTSPYFEVREIEVVGVERAGATELKAAAGIIPGANLFSIDPARVQSRLEALPQIKRAQVIREIPNRVTLVIEERVPFALAQAGGLVWVDEDGAVLEDQPRPVFQALPLLSGLSAEELTPGRRTPSDRLSAALILLRLILRTGGRLPSEISEVDVTRPDAPILYTIEGVEVRLGNDGWEERLGRLDGLLGQLKNQNEPVESLDLRFQNLVVMRPKGGK